MKKAGILVLLLALALLLAGCGADEENKLDRNVIRVGNVVYTYGELLDTEASTRSYYDQMAQMYALYGMEAPAVTDEEIRDEAFNTLLWQAVVLDKANQMKISELTNSELLEIADRTKATLEDYREQMASMMTFEEGLLEAEKDARIDAALQAAGITREAVYRVEREGFIIEKTQAWAVADVKVSEEEIRAAFDAQVASERATMEGDPNYYGYQVLNGAQPLYAPAGYREVEWLMIDYPEAELEKLMTLDSALYTAQDDTDAAEERVTALLGEGADVDALVQQVQVTLDEVTDPAAITVKEAIPAFTAEMDEETSAAVIALASARALEEAYTGQLALATDAANAAIAPEAEEALRRLENGEEWARVQAHYNDDADMYYGSPVVCADFPYAPEAFVTAAMALTQPGETSQAVNVDGYGCFIIRYVGDVAEGAVDVATVRASIEAELLNTKQQQSFSSTVNIWAEEASKRMLIDYTLMEQ